MQYSTYPHLDENLVIKYNDNISQPLPTTNLL